MLWIASVHAQQSGPGVKSSSGKAEPVHGRDGPVRRKFREADVAQQMRIDRGNRLAGVCCRPKPTQMTANNAQAGEHAQTRAQNSIRTGANVRRRSDHSLAASMTA